MGTPSGLLLIDHTLWPLLCPVCSLGFYLHVILGPGNVSVVDLSLAVALPLRMVLSLFQFYY